MSVSPVLGGGGDANTQTGVCDVTRSDARFEGLMAYAHIDRYQRYLQGLGFRGAAAVHSASVDVLADGAQGYDNSFYYPFADIIVYGSGGVDDAEDAEVVLHEYGHALQWDQVPAFGTTGEAAAVGAGFGDFQAAAYYARTSGGFGGACFAEWEGSSKVTAWPSCMRRLESSTRYPKEYGNEGHA